MKTPGLVTTLLALMGIATLAFADGPPVWPSGVNPRTGQLINSFCDAQQAILDAAYMGLLPPEFTELAHMFDPGTGDVNGTSFVIKQPFALSIGGNGMPDCTTELKLLEEALRDIHFSVNGLTHPAVHAAWNANDAQFAADFGVYWPLMSTIAPGLRELLKGHMIIGDGGAVFSEGSPPNCNRGDFTGSAGFVECVMFLFGNSITQPFIDLTRYVRMPQYFSKRGDADGDGASNACEYAIQSVTYSTDALDPQAHPTENECNCADCGFAFAGISGGGRYEEGAPLELAVLVSGECGDAAYQWFQDGSPIAGATDPARRIADPVQADSGVYHCQATDQNTCKTLIDTGPILVEVIPEGSLPIAGLAGIGAALCALLAFGARLIRRSTKT